MTHLHSYATPFIRYDLGDLALLKDRCPCGHNGPTLHALHGRATSALKRRDGRLQPFYTCGAEFQESVEFSEFRIRQVEIDRIVVELGGAISYRWKKFKMLSSLSQPGPATIIPRPDIDWGQNVKRQSFRCEV